MSLACPRGGVSMTTPTAREHAQQRVRIFDALEKLFFKTMRKSGECDSVPAERTKNDLLSLTHDGGEVFGTFKTFRVELIDVLRPGRAGGEPTAHRDDLQAADRCIVARCACKLRRDCFAGEFGGSDSFRRKFLERILLLGRRWSIDAGVIRRAELGG